MILEAEFSRANEILMTPKADNMDIIKDNIRIVCLFFTFPSLNRKNPKLIRTRFGMDQLYKNRELYVKKNKIWGAFSRHSGETGTKRFRSGIRMTQDRISMFTRR